MSSFNFTGRQRILHDDLRIELQEGGGKVAYRLGLKLGEYGLPADARVFVEPERGRALRLRHDWGELGVHGSTDYRFGKFEDISLLGELEAVRFRIMVVEAATCRILALAEQIRPYNSNDSTAPQQSLLPVVMADLNGGIWDLDFSGAVPVLRLDRSLGDQQLVRNNPVFLAAVMPGVVRAILIWVAHELAEVDEDAEVEAVQWLRMGEVWAGYMPSDMKDHAEVDRWAQDAVAAFCRSKNLQEKLKAAMDEVE